MEDNTLAMELLHQLKSSMKKWFIAFIIVLIMFFASNIAWLYAWNLPVESTTTTLEIQPNKFYKFGEVTELNLTLAEITDTTQLNEYMFEFVSGATATTLTLPSSVKWLETPTIEANKIYQCSIVDNIGVLLGVSNV